MLPSANTYRSPRCGGGRGGDGFKQKILGPSHNSQKQNLACANIFKELVETEVPKFGQHKSPLERFRFSPDFFHSQICRTNWLSHGDFADLESVEWKSNQV